MGVIVAIYKGFGIRGALNYVLAPEKGQFGAGPQIIDRLDVAGTTPRELSAGFRAYRELVGRGKDVFDIAFSWRNEERPEAKLRAQYIAEWFKEMGLEECPRVVVEHLDAARVNDHAVGLYLDRRGRRIHQGWDWSRSNKICAVLDEKHGLRAERRTKEGRLDPSIPRALHAVNSAGQGKLETAKAVFRAALDRTKAAVCDWDTLERELFRSGYELIRIRKRDGSLQGLVLNGPDDSSFKVSDLDRSWSFPNLVKKHHIKGELKHEPLRAGMAGAAAWLDELPPTMDCPELPGELGGVPAGPPADRAGQRAPDGLGVHPRHKGTSLLERVEGSLGWVRGWARDQYRGMAAAPPRSPGARGPGLGDGLLGARIPDPLGPRHSQGCGGRLAVPVCPMVQISSWTSAWHRTDAHPVPRDPQMGRGADPARLDANSGIRAALVAWDCSRTGFEADPGRTAASRGIRHCPGTGWSEGSRIYARGCKPNWRADSGEPPRPEGMAPSFGSSSEGSLDGRSVGSRVLSAKEEYLRWKRGLEPPRTKEIDDLTKPPRPIRPIPPSQNLEEVERAFHSIWETADQQVPRVVVRDRSGLSFEGAMGSVERVVVDRRRR